MGDVGAVVAVPILQKRLRPDHLGPWGELYRDAIEFCWVAFLEPMVGTLMTAAAEPKIMSKKDSPRLTSATTFVVDIHLEAMLLEMQEDTGEIAASQKMSRSLVPG